jgi:hypothetical protein
MSAVDWLLESDEPGIVFQVKRDLLGEQDPPETARVLDGQRVRALLAGQQPDGGFGVNVYGKWGGAHWRLVSLVELGVPAREKRCVAAAETVLDWLSGASHRSRVKALACRQPLVEAAGREGRQRRGARLGPLRPERDGDAERPPCPPRRQVTVCYLAPSSSSSSASGGRDLTATSRRIWPAVGARPLWRCSWTRTRTCS